MALSGNEVFGTVLAGYDGDHGWLCSVAVHPMHRRKGIRMNLIGHAEEALNAQGCMRITLQIVSSNESVKTSYKSLGYSTELRISIAKRSSRILRCRKSRLGKRPTQVVKGYSRMASYG
ncbi:GNAT family N-acetyltransferase [Pseudomonas sp. S3_B08]